MEKVGDGKLLSKIQQALEKNHWHCKGLLLYYYGKVSARVREQF